MANIVIMPRLSLNDKTNFLAEWYVHEGDTVHTGDHLFSIETDKSSMDVDSDFDGTVLKLYCADGDVVNVLSPVCAIGAPGEQPPDLAAAAAACGSAQEPEAPNEDAAPQAAGSADGPWMVIMPRLSLNDESCLLAEWFVQPGGTVHAGDDLFSIETDKSSMNVTSEYDGVVLKRYFGEGDIVTVLTPVCAIGQEGQSAPDTPPTQPEAAAEPQSPAPAAEAKPAALCDVKQPVKISPRARRAAALHKITAFGGIAGSGTEGRILEEDVLRYAAEGHKVLKTMDDSTVVAFTHIRKAIAKNMIVSLQNTAQLTLNASFNASALQKCRAVFKKSEGATKNITIGDLIVYGTAKTLEDFPGINAWVGTDSMTMFDIVNIGVAVDTERGLLVPTIMNASEKNLLAISEEMKELAALCYTGKLPPDRSRNATFTISNLGSFGIRSFTPVINPPQAAILGIGTIDYAMQKTPDGMLCYPRCNLSLTIDHRALDGAPAARFLKQLCGNLEHIDSWVDMQAAL